ncbi:MAG: CPBP family intramembrane glutamic endopeptidase [Methanomassiliicoccales archaeon]|jgi:hypothetical protein
MPLRKEASTWQKARKFAAIFVAWAAFAIFIEVVFNIAALTWGTTIIFPNSGYHFAIFIVTPYLVTLFEVTGWSFLIYFSFIFVAIVASFLWMTKKSWRPFRNELVGQSLKDGHSPLFAISTVFFAVLFFNIAFNLIIMALGIDPSSSGIGDGELWETMYSLANASVWEEIITRVMYIGAPLLLYDILRKDRKDLRRYFLGGGFELKGFALFLLFFSAGMFGAAHVFNWDLWKVFPTFVSGMGLGYLFLRYGLYASIMMHFFVDYLSIPTYVSDSDAALAAVGLLTLVIIAAGFICFVYYLGNILRFLFGWELALEKPVTAGDGQRTRYQGGPPQQYSPPVPYHQAQPRQDFMFVCKYCGGTEARYQDGSLTCMRCQRKN